MMHVLIRRGKRAAFTLVEMSIVLVIISLIIGGVLVGQELAHGAEINSIVGDVNRIKTSVANFRLKYMSWPGDMKDATNYWTGTSNGNGDGYMDLTGMWTGAGEFWWTWQHLALSGILPGNYTGATNSASDVTSSVVPDVNMMGNKIGGFYGLGHFTDAGTNPLHDGNAIAMWGGNPYITPLTPADARVIDLKLDDGMPGTGIVSGSMSAGACSDTSDLRTANYNLSNTSLVCGLIFWFD